MGQQRLFITGLMLAASAFGQSALENVIIGTAKPYDQVVAAVQRKGGQVTQQYRYVNAIAAQVPSSALADIRALPGVTAMVKDTVVQVAPVANSILSKGGIVQSSGVVADAVNPLSNDDVRALSASASPSAYTVNNTLMGLDPLFAAGKQGNGIIVAVIDSGIRPGFPHISGSVIGGDDLAGDGLGVSNFANNGHGTFVAGMIAAHVAFLFSKTSTFVRALNLYAPGAAVPFNTTQSLVPMVGTAPAASIYAIRVFGPSGGAPTSTIMKGIERAIQLRELYDSGAPAGVNIRVCNMSLGGAIIEPGFDPEDQLIDQLLAHDIVPVIAAGNAGPAALTVGSPATSMSALAVGAASLAHNERIVADLSLGTGGGALYRPFGGTLMAYFSSRGPDADGRVQPHVLANGFYNFGMGLGTTTSTIDFGAGTSFATPSVTGIAAVLRQAYPNATARQIRNAIILSANPNLVSNADVLDQGHGFVNATAASNLLAAGAAPDSVAPLPKANGSVKVNVEQNTTLKVMDGLVRQTLTLRPGERHDIVYRVNPNTAQVVVSLSNFVAGPAAQQNQLLGDDLIFAVHSAKTSSIGEGDYVSPVKFVHTGTAILNNPETGLMRISVDGDWTNAGNVSIDVTIASTTDPIPQFTSQDKIVTSKLVVFPFTVPAGTGTADLRLSWRDDWGTFPAADIDLILVSPSSKVNVAGATLNNPETVTIQKPEAGTWLALIDGFNVPGGTDKYELRIALDGNVIH